MKWISVLDRVPKIDYRVLVSIEGRYVHVAYLRMGRWIDPGSDGWSFGGVTHWMPLPLPAKLPKDKS